MLKRGPCYNEVRVITRSVLQRGTTLDHVTFKIYKVCDEIGSKFCKGELLITTVRRDANVKRFEEEMRANWGHYYH